MESALLVATVLTPLFTIGEVETGPATTAPELSSKSQTTAQPDGPDSPHAGVPSDLDFLIRIGDTGAFVQPSSGNLHFQFGLGGTPIVLYFNSLIDNDPIGLGNGWSISFAHRLIVGDTITLVLDDGRSLRFEDDPFSEDPEALRGSAADGARDWTAQRVVTADGTRVFRARCRDFGIEFPLDPQINGSSQLARGQFGFGGAGRSHGSIASGNTSNGEILSLVTTDLRTVVRAENSLVWVECSNGVRWRIERDPMSLLPISVASVPGTHGGFNEQISLAYDDRGNLASIDRPDDRDASIYYRDEHVSYAASKQSTWSFSFQQDGSRTIVLRPQGLVFEYRFDPLHATCLEVRRNDETEFQRELDSMFRPVRESDGHTETRFHYDSDGSCRAEILRSPCLGDACVEHDH